MKESPIVAKNDYVICTEEVENGDRPFDVVDSSAQKVHLRVLSTGPNVDQCKVGDRVVPFGNEFQMLQYDGAKYIILTNEQILGVFA